MSGHLLGSGENRAYVYSRNGRQRLAELGGSGLDWGRTLSEVSRCNINVPADRCTSDLNKIDPWAHSIVVYRDQERVWEGPVRKVQHLTSSLSITASDVLGWCDRRPTRNQRRLAASPVVTELLWAINGAFGTDDPHVLAHVLQVGGNGANVVRDLARLSGYTADDLGTLVGLGARYTVIGRRIVAWSEGTTIGRLPTLVPEDHLQAEVTVTKDGDLLATEAIARDDNAAWQSYPLAGYVDAYYGHVSMLVPVSGQQKPAGLTRAARSARDQGYPGQLVLEVPSNALVRCEAPYPIDTLVPGVLVPVETRTATGLEVSATFALSGVSVSQAAGEDERVGITVAPLTAAVTA